ncbi:MAG: UDP-N-acetylglucosamine 4,6-dehydratase (inverting) [Gammaproteobacteria bacterium]
MARDLRSPEFDFNGKSILVTGGTGSFGRHFARTILNRFKPRRLVIFSRDEWKQYDMGLTLSDADHPCLRYFIGDVRDAARLEMAMRGVEYVVHAAALKQVPTAEYNPFECIHTNVLGAENVVQAAIRAGVRKVIALSTDKAASPLNLYGASKLASDKIFVAANNLAGSNGPRFSVVRYGNVVGSRGSVVPLFRRLIDNGATSLPLTSREMTRFWITLEQGVNFVISSFELMRGGEIFVPRIPSMRIEDLAQAMAPGLATHEIGIRPGEKLHEIMITEDDARFTLALDDRYAIMPSFHGWEADERAGGPRAVPANFRYSSDSNDEWLSKEDFLRIVEADHASHA